MKKNKGARLVGIGVLVAVSVLFVVLAVYVYGTWPVYPAFAKEIASLSELREVLGESERTSTLFVVDLSDFGVQAQKISVDLDGRTRSANPVCYHVEGQTAEESTGFSLGVSAGNPLWTGGSFEGTSYRNADAKLFVPEDQSTRRGVELDLRCGTNEYAIAASFDTTGLSEQEITQRDADLQELLYAVADRIIDGAG